MRRDEGGRGECEDEGPEKEDGSVFYTRWARHTSWLMRHHNVSLPTRPSAVPRTGAAHFTRSVSTPPSQFPRWAIQATHAFLSLSSPCCSPRAPGSSSASAAVTDTEPILNRKKSDASGHASQPRAAKIAGDGRRSLEIFPASWKDFLSKRADV